MASWPRPVPQIGDATSARQRGDRPNGWAFSPEDRASLYAVVGARRDIRHFRPDPVPDEVLRRVLGAAHQAPSVGHSQPWRFVVVRSPATRQQALVLADRHRLAQAAGFDDGSARQFLDLQLEGIRDAPLGVVVCCDRRVPAAGVLGRATFVDADMWSCACAIENLWLAARAEGLGMGWVTLFQPEELATLVRLPDGVTTLGWLCLGWPDERPPAPGLERAGWSRRAPLEAVIFEDVWPAPGPGPGAGLSAEPPPSHLRAPDQGAVVAVRDHADRLLTPPGSLGALDRAVDRLLALGAGDQNGRPAFLVLAGADHPVCAYRISAYEQRVTRDVVEAAVAGRSYAAAAATSAGLNLIVVDAGVAGPGPVQGALDARPTGSRGDLVTADALTAEDVFTLVEAGRRVGSQADRGSLVALGEVGVCNTTVAAALAAVLLDQDPSTVVGRGVGADSEMLQRKVDVVSSATRRAHLQHGSTLHDPIVALGAVGGPELAVLAGVVMGAVAAGAAVVLDGLATSLAAVAAVRLEPAVAAHLVAGHRSREVAHPVVLAYLGLEPLLDLRIRAGEGVGACLATGLLCAALRLRQTTAVTEEP